MSDWSEINYAHKMTAAAHDSGGRNVTDKLPFVPATDLAREHRERLEQMVDERTAELRGANEQLGREISERHQAEAALQHSLGYQTTINALLGLALKQAPLETLLLRALDLVLSLPACKEASSGAIFVAEESGVLTLKAHRGLPDSVATGCQQLELGQCLCGQAAKSGELLQVTQMSSKVGDKSDLANLPCSTAEYTGHCGLPFRVEDQLLGVLSLLLPTEWVLAEWEVRVLGGVSDLLANIIARKRGETKQAELEDQLRYSQKLEAVGRLAGGVAHDFNNLLTVIQGNVFLNLSEPDLSDQLRDDLLGIDDASKRAATLTRQLLAFGRKQVLRPQETDVNTIVLELEKMLRRVIGEDINLQVNLSEGLWCTEVDPGQLEQVILNLAVNARDAMPRGGELVLETSNVELGPQDLLRRAGTVPGPYVRLSIQDTGIGMDTETLQQVFEPFFTTKDVGEGSGLGLATAYGIVRQSDGYIWATSEPGKGTTLVIHLPRLELEDSDETERFEPPDRAAQESTILLVEDEDDVRKVARRVLQKAGHRVLEACNSQAALEIAGGCDDVIHLLVTDVIMPGLSGDELAARLGPTRPEMKILYISGYSGDVLLERGVETVRLLQKPFNPADLAAMVAQILDGS